MIWLLGDSIFRGFALGRFPDVFTPEEIEAESLWPLRSPDSMINLMVGEEAAAWGGVTGLPDAATRASAKTALRKKLESGQIKPGVDQLVFLDVGHHAETPDEHRQQWLDLRSTATATAPIDLFICTGFDGLSGLKKPKTHFGGVPLASVTHDERFNQAVIEAATAGGDFQGRTTVIDLAKVIASFDKAAADLGASAYRPDRIHLNVWGQLRLSATIMRAVSPDRRLRAGPIKKLIKASWPAVTNSSPAPDRRSTMALVEAALADNVTIT